MRNVVSLSLMQEKHIEVPIVGEPSSSARIAPIASSLIILARLDTYSDYKLSVTGFLGSKCSAMSSPRPAFITPLATKSSVRQRTN